MGSRFAYLETGSYVVLRGGTEANRPSPLQPDSAKRKYSFESLLQPIFRKSELESKFPNENLATIKIARMIKIDPTLLKETQLPFFFLLQIKRE